MKIIKPLDIFAFLLSLGIIIFLSLQVYGKNEGKPMVYIQSDDHEWLYPLDGNDTVSIQGVLGDTVIQILNGEVEVMESPCRDKICVNARPLRLNGDWTACLPNHIFVQIRGTRQEELDDLSF